MHDARAMLHFLHGASAWRNPPCLPGLIILALLLPSQAFALTLLPADLAEVARGSQVIVHARVADVRSQMTNGRRSIESVVTVTVLDTMKGDAVGVLSFRIPVGQVGRYRRLMPGVPEFSAGDEVVLFLVGRPPSLPVPFGLSQGVYRVVHRGAVAVVTPPVIDSAVLAQAVVRGDPSRRPIALDAFEQHVRAAMGSAR